jgi:hypothetical protein
LSDQKRKELNKMEKQYEAPKLVLVGRADDVVLGMPGHGFDAADGFVDDDFEYAED